MKKTPTRHELTPEERDEAARLSAAWAAFKDAHSGASQLWLGQETGIGGQSAVSQYLLGKVALNFSNLIKFCRVLKVDPSSISPRLVNEHLHDPDPLMQQDLFARTRRAVLGSPAPHSNDLNRLLEELEGIETMGPQWADLAQAITMLVRKLKETQRVARHEHLTPEMRVLVEKLCELDKKGGEARAHAIEDVSIVLAGRKPRQARQAVKKAS